MTKNLNDLINSEITPDLSWMWHCSNNPENVLDYSKFIDDPKIGRALTIAASIGFKKDGTFKHDRNE